MAMQFGSQAPFVSVPVSQKLPDQMAYKDSLETASVVAGRQHGVKYTATNGGPYEIGSGQSEIVIPLSSNGYLDLETCCLSYEVQLGGNATTSASDNPVLESGPFAPFSEAILEIGGVQVSRIRRPNMVYNLNAYSTTLQSHDNAEGTIENAWATSQKATITNDSNETLSDKISSLQDPTTLTSLGELSGQDGSYTGSNNGIGATDVDLAYRNPDRNGIKKIVVPLSKLFPFFGGVQSYFPLANIGNITIRLRCHSKLESVVVCQQDAAQAQQALIADASCVLNDVAVFGDVVVPESAYMSAMNQLLGSATGLQIAFPDCEVQVRDYTGTTAVSEYQLNYIVGSRYLSHCRFVLSHVASLNSPNQCSSFSFGSQGFQQARLQLGSMSVPTTTPLRSIEEAYYNLLKSYNMQGNVDTGNAISLKEFCADIYRTGVASTDEIVAPSKFILGFSLEQVLQGNQDLLQGLNTLQNNSVIQLVVDLKGAAKIFGKTSVETDDTACFATGVFNMVKVLSIKMNSVSVESK